MIAVDQLEDARQEFERVLRSAPDNLAAIHELADIRSRCGNTPERSSTPTPFLAGQPRS